MVKLRKPHLHVLLIVAAFGLFWIPVIIFAAIAEDVLEHEPLFGDSAILAAFDAIHGPVLNAIFLIITSLGQPLVVVTAGAIILTLLLAKRYYREATLLIGGLGGAALANLLLKLIFARARPVNVGAVITASGYSFPSGHAMVSSAFAFTIIIMLWRTRYRIPVLIAGITATLLIGTSRIYLGVHFPSDVLAGWVAGVFWACLIGTLIVDRPLRIGKLTPGSLGA